MIYLLGNDDDDDMDDDREEIITVSGGIESAIDVHLRNAMILNTYPERLYFNSLRAITLTLSSYDEFRWIQEHQDYSRLKQRCRQKFLQQGVTKTLVVKGTFALVDMTDEVELIGDSPVGYGSFSDVWKGLWRDRVEKREKMVWRIRMTRDAKIYNFDQVAVKFLRKVIFREPREQLAKVCQQCLHSYAYHGFHDSISKRNALRGTGFAIDMSINCMACCRRPTAPAWYRSGAIMGL